MSDLQARIGRDGACVITEGIARIKEELLSAKELDRIADRFLEWTEANREGFLGNAIDCPRVLRAAVRVATCHVLAKKAALTQEFWFRHDGGRFIHGAFWAAGRVCSALFFEDLGMGLVVLAGMSGGPTHFVRFTATGAPPEDPTLN